MRIVNTHDAKTHFSRLLKAVASGEVIIIASAGKPVARLVACSTKDLERTGGQWRGQIRMGSDFDDPLPGDILDAFGAPS